MQNTISVECLFCKGRLWCGKKYCPILAKVYSKKKFQEKINKNKKKEFCGEAPNIFVSRFNYPNINVGILSVEKYDKHDEPKLWSRESVKIEKIIQKRVELINSYVNRHVISARKIDKINEKLKEISLSKKPVESEIKLAKKPKFNINFNQTITPFGPNARLQDVKITENPKIPYNVEKIINDDLKVNEVISKLRKRFDVYYLTKLLASGNLGKKINSKFVPTRWSITAIDDIVGKDLIKKVKQFKENEDIEMYFGKDYGNYFFIILFPEKFRYELMEIPIIKENIVNHTPKKFVRDYEGNFGRKSYAKETVGGYYAVRYSVLKKLNEKKKQASVLVIRLITEEYWMPLGVWVVRETSEKVMNKKGIKFESIDLALSFVKEYVKKHFNIDISYIIKQSKLIEEIKNQNKITKFFKKK